MCPFEWHNWTTWNEPHEQVLIKYPGNVFQGQYTATVQDRHCQNCRLVERREVKP